MRIALISNTSWNILNFRLGLIESLQAKGFEVVYYAPYDECVEVIAQRNAVPYRPIKHLQRKGYNPLADVLLTLELYRFFKQDRIDLVLNYTVKPNIYGSIAARLAGTKAIANLTGLGFLFLKESLANRFAIRLYQVGLWFAHRVVFQNQTDKTLFESRGLCSANKTVLIPGSGINTSHYKPSGNTLPAEPFVFLFIGRLLYDKGIREFVGAANQLHAQYPNMQFHLVGALDEGNPSAVAQHELDAWLAQNTQLRYLGVQSDVRSYIEAAHAVVLPSYREGIPRVLLEAMALEKPFITVKSPGFADVTEHGINGLLAEVGSADSLYKAMLALFQMTPAAREEMGLAGRKRVETQYDEKIVTEAYFRLILSLS